MSVSVCKEIAMASLPILDMSKRMDTLHGRQELALQLVTALQEVGFLYLDNVEEYFPEDLHRATEWFFNLPLEAKMETSRKQWKKDSKFLYRGYFPLEERDSYKEGIEFAAIELSAEDPDRRIVMYEPNQWPVEDGSVPFREIMTNHSKAMYKLTLKINRLLSIGLGKEENYFDHCFQSKSLSTLRLLHYPTRDSPPPPLLQDGDLVIQCAEHYDFSFATFLSTFDYHGLQIRGKGDNQWLDVDPRPNSLVMNIGETLVRMTKEHNLKATVHRVVDRGERCFSVPFFVEPHYWADVGSSKTSALYGPWMLNRIRYNKEYCDTDFGELVV